MLLTKRTKGRAGVHLAAFSSWPPNVPDYYDHLYLVTFLSRAYLVMLIIKRGTVANANNCYL